MDRRLQAVSMVMAEELQELREARELAPQVWSIEWEILHEESPEGQQLFTKYGDFFDGFVKLKFYRNDRLEFDFIMSLYKGDGEIVHPYIRRSSFPEEAKAFSETISESPSKRAMITIGIWYPSMSGLNETYITYLNSVLTLDFVEVNPPDCLNIEIDSHDGYSIIMPRSRVIETFLNIARDVQAYIDGKKMKA